MKVLIFDFDGTIADSFEPLLEVFEIVTKRPRKLTAKEVSLLRGQSLRDIIKYLKIRKWQIPRMILQAKKIISAGMTDLETFPGTAEVLKELNARSYKMYILSTNSSENIGKFLREHGLDGYFSGVYGDIGLRSKSSALIKLMKKEGLSPADCYYMGDEVRDVEAAKKAGVKSVGVTWGFNYPEAIKAAAPDFTADSPKDLLKILK